MPAAPSPIDLAAPPHRESVLPCGLGPGSTLNGRVVRRGSFRFRNKATIEFRFSFCDSRVVGRPRWRENAVRLQSSIRAWSMGCRRLCRERNVFNHGAFKQKVVPKTGRNRMPRDNETALTRLCEFFPPGIASCTPKSKHRRRQDIFSLACQSSTDIFRFPSPARKSLIVMARRSDAANGPNYSPAGTLA